MSNFINNRIERTIGMDLNGDGYLGGQGFMSRVERATHIDFNGDNMIGRRPDLMYGGGGYGYGSPYGYGGGFPGQSPYGYGAPGQYRYY